MKTTYTPGPWNLEAGRSIQTKNGSFYITYGKDKNGNPNFPDFCELDRNARLIAAAPELLKALQALLNYGNLGAYERADAIKAARAAITKATGDQS